MPNLLLTESNVRPRQFAVPWNIVDVLILLAIDIGFQFVLGVVASHASSSWPPVVLHFVELYQKGDLSSRLLAYLANLAASATLVGWLLSRYRAKLSALGWRRSDLATSVLFCVVALVALLIGSPAILSALHALIPSFNPNQSQQNYYAQVASGHRVLAFIALVILPPIFEETIYRGFVFPVVANRWGVAIGAVVSSVIFALAHLQANIDVYTFIMALVMCVMYARLKSILPGMAVHMINNYLAFMAMASK